MSKWLKKVKVGIPATKTKKEEHSKKDWNKCPSCKKVHHENKLKDSYFVCGCGFHFRIEPYRYFELLFDDSEYETQYENIYPVDPLNFKDIKSYKERLEKAQEKTGDNEAVSVATGKLNKSKVIIVGMNFSFIGGSLGSVSGERISRAIDLAAKTKTPLIIISKSGGVRLMESGIALMQLVKTSTGLTKLDAKKVPYISVLTDPTTGGVCASFAMLGDFIIAEPKALIGYAGPRVIRETIGRDLPKGFQTSEFLLEHGFIDFIVERKELRSKLSALIGFVS